MARGGSERFARMRAFFVVLVAVCCVVEARRRFSVDNRPGSAQPRVLGTPLPWRDDPDAEFVSGTVPLDTEGQPMHVHSGYMLTQDDGLTLWYGAGQKFQVDGNWVSDSIRLYTSRDLSSWKAKGRVFLNTSIPELSVPPPYSVGAVKALYNAATRRYVLVFAISGGGPSGDPSAIGFATSVAPSGPFKWELAAPPDGLPAYDFAVAADDDGRGAYLVRGTGPKGTSISRLKEGYLGAEAPCGLAPRVGTPAVFRSGGRWYLLGSRRNGWKPRAPQLFVSNGSELCGASWTKLSRPADGEGAATTYNSQPAFVRTVRWQDGGELQVYVGDRWNWGGEGGPANASYVFLPLLPSGGDPPGFKLLWLDRWRLGDYKPAAPS